MFHYLHRRYTTRLQVPQQLLLVDYHRAFAPLLRFVALRPHQVHAAAAHSSDSRIRCTSASSSQTSFRRIRMNSAVQATTTISHFPFTINARRWCSTSSSSTANDDTSTTAADLQQKIGEQTTAQKTTDTTAKQKKVELLDFIFDQSTTLAQAVCFFTKQNLHEQVQNQLASITVKDFLDGSAANRFDSDDVNKIRADTRFKLFDQAFLDSVSTQQQLIQLQVTSWHDLAKLIVDADASLERKTKLETVKTILGGRIDIETGLKYFIESLITEESTSKLRPLQTFRHTSTFPFGMRGRELPVGQLKASLGKHSSTLTTKETPFIVVTSMPGQGTTRFVDEIGYSPELIATLAGTWEYDPNSAFIFNVTFSSNWKIATDKEYSLQEARNEVSLRLIAAAMGIFTAEQVKESGQANVVRAYLSMSPRTVREVVEWIKETVWQKYHSDVDPRKGTWFFLFDELTELGDRIKRGAEAKQTQETQKIEFYSSLADIIGTRCAVIGSGFTDIVLHGPMSVSMRPVSPCTLLPVVKSVQRRELLVMKTLYFQLMSMYSPSEAVLFYELAKSSPGVFGAILEVVMRQSDSDDGVPISKGDPSFDGILASALNPAEAHGPIPILKWVGDWHDAMLHVLEWKSLQFCSFTWQGDALDRLTDQMSAECKSAEDKRVVSVKADRVAWLRERPTMEQRRLRHQLHQQYQQQQQQTEFLWEPKKGSVTTLDSVLVEPLFFFWKLHLGNVVDDSGLYYFTFFVDALKEHSKSCSQLKSHRSPPIPTEQTGVNKTVACRFSAVGENNISVADTQSMKKVNNLSELNGNFFADAVAVGICAQKQLRSSLKTRLRSAGKVISSPITSSLGAFLGNDHLPLIDTTASKSIRVEWISAGDHQNQPVLLREFDLHYPGRVSENVEYDKAHVIEEQTSVHTTIDNYFNVHTVLHPRRPENNPLVDIIFHEKVANSNNNNINNGDLIQFWVDTKHSHETVEPFNGGIDNFKKRVQAALNNPILTSKSSKIKHVVHIIVSTFKPDEATRTALEQVGIALPQPGTTNQRWLRKYFHSTPSYTLYVIHPDSLAFEHLVSHVIARSIPLMEQQHIESWSRSLGCADQWRTFKAMSTDGSQLDASLDFVQVKNDFAEWRRLRLDDDCISTFQSLFDSTEQAFDAVRAAAFLLSRDLNSPRFRNTVHKFIRLPFGAFLEAFGIIEPSLLYNRYYNNGRRIDGETKPLLELSIDDNNNYKKWNRKWRILTLFKQDASDDQVILRLNFDNYSILDTIFSFVKIGHLLEHENWEIWDSILDPQSSAQTSNIISFTEETSASKAQLVFACKLWNLPAREWFQTTDPAWEYRSCLSNKHVKMIDKKVTKFRNFIFSRKGMTAF